ncbi:MAG: DUF72 domain-containing protein [Salinibacter sp.]|uniref:DUF72 domain-containing protein n=1 Tax=Salinibacter sp. TaxID=2065818 RepID=UPI0035D46B2B
MSTVSIQDRRSAIDAYDFRDVHPNVRFGTASDRYGGWIGQIYPADRYADRVSTRSRTLGGETFEERRVPIESVRDYFEHFEVLEIDFTFYRPLLEEGDEPGSNYFVLSNYADHAPGSASFLLKAPQKFFARSIRRDGQFVDNPGFLDADGYVETFLEPALDILGDRLDGVIFQQEYQRVADSPSPEENVEQLDAFFDAIPDEVQSHVELRSEHLLSESYFDWLAARGLGHVFSHWTWLPAIRRQWSLTGERLTAKDGQVVARLLTPRDMKYAEAYAKAYPFDEPESALADTEQARDMVLDTTALAYRAASQNALLNVIANNRAWGNAPDLNRTIAHRILDEEERQHSS